MRNTTNFPARGGHGAPAWLLRELSPFPGRGATAARIALGCALVVYIGELYGIPLPAYLAYAVFIVCRPDLSATLKTGIAAVIAFSAAVCLSLLFYSIDASEPALRLPLMGLSAFLAMFASRTMRLGPVAFLTGFVLVISQSLIDDLPNLEALTHFVLWLWVIVLVPVLVTFAINGVALATPAAQARQAAPRLVRDLAAALRSGTPSGVQEAEILALAGLQQGATASGKRPDGTRAGGEEFIETLAEASLLLRFLPAGMPDAWRAWLAGMFEASADELAAGGVKVEPLAAPAASLALPEPAVRVAGLSLAAAAARLHQAVSAPIESASDSNSKQPSGAFLPDAFTNPDHVRFAAKTALAVMACYILYTLMDWPGLRTSITTCFFVALASVGASVQKLLLRLGGAALGGLAGGLAIVFVLPALDDTGGLCLVVALIAAGGAWISAGSERLSYGGMQFAFAAFLALLQGDAAPTDLTGARDRVIGVLLGNIVISLVFSTVWPVTAVQQARHAASAVLAELSAMAAAVASAPGATSGLDLLRKLAVYRDLSPQILLEQPLISATSMSPDLPAPQVLDRLAAATISVRILSHGDDGATPDDATADILMRWSARLRGDAAPADSDRSAPIADKPAQDDAAGEARRLLRDTIRAAMAGVVPA